MSSPLGAPPAPYNLRTRDRWTVVALAVGGALAFGASYFLPYWNFKLVAPQYPKGLFMTIFLSGVGGAVDEVDIINHYIGMHKLTDAAPIERAIGVYAVAAIAVAGIAAMLVLGRRVNKLAIGLAVALPLGFLADTLYWMYRFGHNLDPAAPIDFAPFMPQLFGHGVIGQFHTWAWPGPGFWLAVVGGVLVIGAVWLRERVCVTCPAAATCGKTCPHHFVPPKAQLP
jgi:copper chaperone NosL